MMNPNSRERDKERNFKFFSKIWRCLELILELLLEGSTTLLNKINITTHFENLIVELHVFYTSNKNVKFV